MYDHYKMGILKGITFIIFLSFILFCAKNTATEEVLANYENAMIYGEGRKKAKHFLTKFLYIALAIKAIFLPFSLKLIAIFAGVSVMMIIFSLINSIVTAYSRAHWNVQPQLLISPSSSSSISSSYNDCNYYYNNCDEWNYWNNNDNVQYT